MWAFLQTYGIWIVFGLFFLFMLRMHSGGGGCGMGHDQHQGHTSQGFGQGDRQPEEHGTARRTTLVRDDTWKEERPSAEPTATNQHSRGCH